MANANTLAPGGQLVVEAWFRPHSAGSSSASLLFVGHAAGARVTRGITLIGNAVPAKPENADKRELQVATRRSRDHKAGVTLSDNASYSDMLAAVIAAANLTEHDRDRPHARRLLATVQARLHELKPVAHEKLKAYGFGNAGGHAIFDSASGAIDSWIRNIDLNSSIATDAFVTRFRVGAETIRICTGERADAPNLRAVDHAGRQTAVVAAATTLAPGVLAVAAEEAALLGFIARTSGQRLTVWAITHPAAALVASEALIGFGVQIGQDGWDEFIDGLRTPTGALFVAAQIAMDFMHVQMARTPTGAADSSAELEGLRSRYAQARAVLEQATYEAGTAPQPRSSVANAPDATTRMNTSEVRLARYKPTTMYDPSLRSDTLGETDKYGNIRIRPGMSPTDEALTLAHEQVHSALSPKVALLREFRADVGFAAYGRSAFLKYTEEALAETIANIRVKGFSIPAVVEGLKFPVTEGYVTFSRLAKETAIGTIVYAGIVYAVYLETSSSDHSDQKGGQP